MPGAIFCNGVYYNGQKGDTGVGISEIVDNEDGTFSIFLTDGHEYIISFPTPFPTSVDVGKIVRVDDDGNFILDNETQELPVPSVTDDVGKILSVDEQGHWAMVATPADELPSVTSADEGKLLMVDASGNWIASAIENGNEVSY